MLKTSVAGRRSDENNETGWKRSSGSGIVTWMHCEAIESIGIPPWKESWAPQSQWQRSGSSIMACAMKRIEAPIKSTMSLQLLHMCDWNLFLLWCTDSCRKLEIDWWGRRIAHIHVAEVQWGRLGRSESVWHVAYLRWERTRITPGTQMVAVRASQCGLCGAMRAMWATFFGVFTALWWKRSKSESAQRSPADRR